MKIKEEKTYAHNIKHNKRTKIKIKEENNIYLWGKLISNSLLALYSLIIYIFFLVRNRKQKFSLLFFFFLFALMKHIYINLEWIFI